MSQFQNIFRSLPYVTKNLIIINALIWLAMIVFSRRFGASVLDFGALHYFEAEHFGVWQLFTYMFMHSTQSFTHLLFNMFTLFMFGIVLERVMGSPRFLFFYISCGLGAAMLQEAVWAVTLPSIAADALAVLNNTSAEQISQFMTMNPEWAARAYDNFTTVGASGAIYGILAAFGILFPNRPMYLMFIPVPVKAKWMVLGFVGIELLIGLSSANDGVAHFAHLGGMIVGAIMVWIWKRNGTVHGDVF